MKKEVDGLKNIFDYRLVIIDDEGELVKYEKEFGVEHQDCIIDFAKKKEYTFANKGLFVRPEDIVRNGNVLFYNTGNNMLLIYLPTKLTESQLYQLDYIENWMNKATYINAAKFDKEGQVTEEYTFDNLNDESLGTPTERFSKEIIQSYYTPKKRR